MTVHRQCPSCRSVLLEVHGDRLQCPTCERRVTGWLVTLGDELVAAGRASEVCIGPRLAGALEEARESLEVVEELPRLVLPSRRSPLD